MNIRKPLSVVERAPDDFNRSPRRHQSCRMRSCPRRCRRHLNHLAVRQPTSRPYFVPQALIDREWGRRYPVGLQPQEPQ
eukprot:1702380-Pyramimonas_sp.AAC.1